MKKDELAHSISIIGVISFSLIFCVFLILYIYWGDENSVQNSISTTGSLFGALATLGAAIVAILLFNDWKEQHNKQVQNNLALQVFDAFSVFERNIREFSLNVSHLESLRSSYDGFELTWDLIQRDGHLIYIQNIQSKKDEMDLNFYTLMDKLKSYYIINDNFEQYTKSYSKYFDYFVNINRNMLPINSLTDQIAEYDSNIIGYNDLKTTIDTSEIQKIISSLNA
ncbi:hypothetical protein MMP66_07705 [Acinetobacter dispersus]|uniref:hypothetical protein n=1 Tax=Acinetobacter dispersus TaxID=70348 RepID=UPI001F4AC955|nr:hypothetical protein [Acinetobacter dispersus]MCH7394164.1 hypothetical protein [Acinetobacter dispersus]